MVFHPCLSIGSSVSMVCRVRGLYWHHSMLAPSERTSMLCSMAPHFQLMLMPPSAVGQMSGVPSSARQCSVSQTAVRSNDVGFWRNGAGAVPFWAYLFQFFQL